MLKKLLKYDLKSTLKFLSIFYILAIIFSILTRIFYSIENSFIISIIAQICSGATIAMIANIIINSLMRGWVRFNNNFYKDESYLTHTLPISKTTLYLSKILQSLITLFISTIVIIITLFIAYYSKENLETLKNFLLPLANIYNSTIIKIILAFLFIIFLELANTLQAGYTGLILGHRLNNNKTLFSVIIGFITYLIIQLTVVILLFIIGIFNPNIMSLFISNNIASTNILKTVIYLAFIIYSVTLIINFYINIKLFNKGVNID